MRESKQTTILKSRIADLVSELFKQEDKNIELCKEIAGLEIDNADIEAQIETYKLHAGDASSLSNEVEQLMENGRDREGVIERLEAEIDQFWEGLWNRWEIESREEIEKDTKESWATGTSPMNVALHYIWKREPKVAKLEAELKAQEWVSVEDRLPVKRPDHPWSSAVMLYFKSSGTVSTDWYDSNIEDWVDCHISKPTHWKPIVLPKEQD